MNRFERFQLTWFGQLLQAVLVIFMVLSFLAIVMDDSQERLVKQSEDIERQLKVARARQMLVPVETPTVEQCADLSNHRGFLVSPPIDAHHELMVAHPEDAGDRPGEASRK